MNILAINGSPRKDGNTSSLIDRVLEGARSRGAATEKIDISDLRIRFVMEDDYSRVNADQCGRYPDELSVIIDAISSSDVIILASPIFFGSITGQLKVVIDRFQFAWLEKNAGLGGIFPQRKRGVFLSVQAQDRPDFFNNASSIVKHFFATINISYESELFFDLLERSCDARENKAYMDKAFSFGQSLLSGTDRLD